MAKKYQFKDEFTIGLSLLDYTEDIDKVLYYKGYFMILFKNERTAGLVKFDTSVPFTRDCTENYRVHELLRKIDGINSKNAKAKCFTDFIKRIIRMLYDEFC